MAKQHKQAKKSKKELFWIILGTALLIFGIAIDIFYTINHFTVRAKNRTVQGVVYEVSSGLCDGDGCSCDSVKVEYVIDGVHYRNDTLLEANGCYGKKGDEITIYYDPDNPYNITDSHYKLTAPIIMSLILIVAFCIVFLFKKWFDKKKPKTKISHNKQKIKLENSKSNKNKK